MTLAFSYPYYLLKRQVLALTGKLRFYSPDDRLVLFAEQKMFRLREDIRVYDDESKSQELLLIQARQIIDWAAAYDVVDSLSGQKVGALRRRGWASLLRDEWEVLDPNDQLLGLLCEDRISRALLRRFLLGALLPQNYDIRLGQTRVAVLRQKFTFFGYQMEIDFSMDAAGRLDRRLGIAAAVLLAIIEDKQQN
ncbi:MAG: hypothetical protein ABWK53_09965 [Anaerolineales bacterium]